MRGYHSKDFSSNVKGPALFCNIKKIKIKKPKTIEGIFSLSGAVVWIFVVLTRLKTDILKNVRVTSSRSLH